MSRGMLARNGNGILGPNTSNFLQNGITNLSFNLFDFLLGLILREAIEEEIDVRSWGQFFMVVLA